MKEQLYTIPVNDAFDADCECPICSMYKDLENDAIEFTLGPSYMEDDIRAETDKTGFCQNHIKKLYTHKNRLGLALMLHTHMKKTTKDIAKYAKHPAPKGGLFGKKESSPVSSYADKISRECYICNRIQPIFERYIATVFHCYKNDEDFQKKVSDGKGFCLKHYGLLTEMAPKYLSGKQLNDFIETLNNSYLTNIKRVMADLEWFIDKFDYRNENEPWKNSKDALPRSITKMDSFYMED